MGQAEESTNASNESRPRCQQVANGEFPAIDPEVVRRNDQANGLIAVGFTAMAAGVAGIAAIESDEFLAPLLILIGGGVIASISAGITLHSDLSDQTKKDVVFGQAPMWYTKAGILVLVLTVEVAALLAGIIALIP